MAIEIYFYRYLYIDFYAYRYVDIHECISIYVLYTNTDIDIFIDKCLSIYIHVDTYANRQ